MSCPCGKPVHARGKCQACYTRARRNGMARSQGSDAPRTPPRLVVRHGDWIGDGWVWGAENLELAGLATIVIRREGKCLSDEPVYLRLKLWEVAERGITRANSNPCAPVAATFVGLPEASG